MYTCVKLHITDFEYQIRNLQTTALLEWENNTDRKESTLNKLEVINNKIIVIYIVNHWSQKNRHLKTLFGFPGVRICCWNFGLLICSWGFGFWFLNFGLGTSFGDE